MALSLPYPSTAFVVLAGGQGRRLSTIYKGSKPFNKALVAFQQHPLITHVLTRLAGQAAPGAININTASEDFIPFGLPVIKDSVSGSIGPLAGILSGLEWLQSIKNGPEWLLVCTCDTPFLPLDLVQKLHLAIVQKPILDNVSCAGKINTGNTGKFDMACVASGDHRHPIIGLFHREQANHLRECITNKQIRKVEDWTRFYKRTIVKFSNEPIDPFFNVNRPEDLKEIEHFKHPIAL